MAKNCVTRNCHNNARRGRYCPKCNVRRWRKNNPVGASYCRLRGHARERNIEFTITLEYWETFCVETGYLQRCGVEGHSLTVDRIRDELGYVPGNIQVLTKAENSKKPRTRAKYQKQPGDIF